MILIEIDNMRVIIKDLQRHLDDQVCELQYVFFHLQINLSCMIF